MKKMLFIFNAHTGGGKLRTKLYSILNCFNDCGKYEVFATPTAYKGHATELVVKYGGKADIVVCCGGDGTLNETVAGLNKLKKPPLLGYIPGGTTNDFATSLRLPKSNMIKAAERIINPNSIFTYDIGLFNEQVFNYVAAFGAFTGVSYGTPQTMKNLLGHMAYILEGAQQIQNPPVHRVHVVGEDRSYESEFILGFVSNSRSVGGFHLPGEFKAVLDDGLFEVILIHNPHNLPELATLSNAIIRKNVYSPALTVMRAKEIKFISETPIAWSLDGEFGGEHCEVDIKVKEKAINICI